MTLWNTLLDFMGGEQSLLIWLLLFLAAGLVAGIWTGWLRAHKIQPKGFKWKTFRNEAIIAVITLIIVGPTMGFLSGWLARNGWIATNKSDAAWWVIGLEYIAYFFLFDTWFYWLHRWMHKEPVYSWVHKMHHWSTSPNLLTTVSVNPLESLVNGGFVPLFLTATTLTLPIHAETMALITPTNIIMGLYVHSGYELFPRWWNKSWLTKWFITATFHDQHHKFFRINFGGYTTLWDRICGTMRPQYEAEFEKIARGGNRPAPVAPSSAAEA
jgi:sterol desaturase/sphingolipid hydroxylase (fatty acid hydroxylase superfamily)